MLVTRTKIIRPRPRPDLVSRPRLLEFLQAVMDVKLFVISAPAGYGKTTLLVDYANETEAPVCWYALDHLDKDPQRFIAHFIAAIEREFPDFGEYARGLTEGGEPDLDRAVTIIANDIYESIREHFVIVLDDYHLIDDSDTINYFVNQLLFHLDENVHMVIASRTLPALPDMSLLVGRNQVGGLDFASLSFQPDEIQALMEQNYDMSMPEAEARRLANLTEGWITGLLLSAQVGTRAPAGGGPLFSAALPSAGVGLDDYLARQVLQQQGPVVQEFLLHSSVMETFSVQSCQELLHPFMGEQDWQSLIATVARSNLFVHPVGDGYVRYHHLFREFLQDQMRQTHPTRVEPLQRQLARISRARGDWDKAYDIYRQLGDVAAMADLIEEAGPQLAQRGQISTLATWLEALPPSALSPSLLSLQGIVLATRGDFERGRGVLDDAIARLDGEEEPALLAQALVRRALVHRFAGAFTESVADADHAIALIDEHQLSRPLSLAEALRVKGSCLHQLGQPEQALADIRRAGDVYEQNGHENNVALAQMDIGVIYESMGRFNEAQAAFEEVTAHARRTHDQMRLAGVLNNLAVVHHARGNYEEAWELLAEGLTAARRSSYPQKEALSLASIGDLYRDLDVPEAARDAYYQAQEVALRLGDRSLLFYLHLAQAELAVEGDPPLAEYQMAEARSRLSEGSPVECGMYQMARAALAARRKRWEDAQEALLEAVSSFGDGVPSYAAAAHFRLAEVYRVMKNEEAALRHLGRAFALTPDPDQHTLIRFAREAPDLLALGAEQEELAYRANHLRQKVADFEQKLPTRRRFLRRRALPSITFGPPQLVIAALGGDLVERDGRLVTLSDWQTRTARDLFFLLLTHPEGLTKEQVGLLVWPDADPGQLKTRFKNAVYRVRRALGQEVIVYGDDHLYKFNWELDYKYDLHTFENLLAQADEEPEPARQIELYTAAVKAYGGEYLPDVDQPWVPSERERLEQAYQQAMLQLARLSLDLQEFRETVHWSRQVTNADGCQEEAYRLAMRAYASLGNRSGVVRQYEQCRANLEEQLGVPPSPQTEALYSRLTV